MSSGKISIYTLSEDFESLLSTMAEQEGEITEEQWEQLEGLTGNITQKLENTQDFRANLLATAEAIKVEEQRLAKRRKQFENQAENLKQVMEFKMKEMGLKKLNTIKWPISLRILTKTTYREDLIHNKYKIGTVKLPLMKLPPRIRKLATVSIDKNMLKKDFKESPKRIFPGIHQFGIESILIGKPKAVEEDIN